VAGGDHPHELAWSGESNGLFSVRLAYRIGIQPTMEKLHQGQLSSEPSGDRSAWNLVWKAAVLQKLRVFAWKMDTGMLAVHVGLHRRIPETDPVCTICGCEEEDCHHALVRCTLAMALHKEMRSIWKLPPQEEFQKT
jgi:hypothetical protein